MKLERISENKIRCILTHSDLSSRQIMLGELAYGSAKAKALFRDMMDLAAEELGFETDDMPIVAVCRCCRGRRGHRRDSVSLADCL